MTVPTPKGTKPPHAWPFEPDEEDCDRCGVVTLNRHADGWLDVWRSTDQAKRGERVIATVCSSSCLAAFAVDLNRQERNNNA